MFGVDGNLPVDAVKVMASDGFFEKYADLAQVMYARPTWSGFDDGKAKALKERIDSDWRHQVPLSLYREAEQGDEAEEGGMSLSEWFEKLDPSPRGRMGEVLTPADAFERQVMLAAQEMGGRFDRITLDQFYRGAPAILVPELLRRWIVAGIAMKAPSVDRLIAVTSPIKGSAFKPIYIPTAAVDTETDLGQVGSGGTGALPRLQIQYRDKAIDSKVFGRVIDVSYRIIQHAPMAKLQMIYKFVGLNLATSLVGSVWTTLNSGDGASGALTARSGTGASGELLYGDLIATFFDVDEVFHINAMIARAAVLIDLLTLPQFQDPEAGFAFQRTGELSAFRPLGSQLYRYDSATDHLIVGLDTRWAMEKGVESEMKIETDKIIAAQFEESAITESHAYAVANDGARASLDFS